MPPSLPVAFRSQLAAYSYSVGRSLERDDRQLTNPRLRLGFILSLILGGQHRACREQMLAVLFTRARQIWRKVGEG
jgi:hypothetical protein